jgi:hypothetical protein
MGSPWFEFVFVVRVLCCPAFLHLCAKIFLVWRVKRETSRQEWDVHGKLHLFISGMNETRDNFQIQKLSCDEANASFWPSQKNCWQSNARRTGLRKIRE